MMSPVRKARHSMSLWIHRQTTQSTMPNNDDPQSNSTHNCPSSRSWHISREFWKCRHLTRTKRPWHRAFYCKKILLTLGCLFLITEYNLLEVSYQIQCPMNYRLDSSMKHIEAMKRSDVRSWIAVPVAGQWTKLSSFKYAKTVPQDTTSALL